VAPRPASDLASVTASFAANDVAQAFKAWTLGCSAWQSRRSSPKADWVTKLK